MKALPHGGQWISKYKQKGQLKPEGIVGDREIKGNRCTSKYGHDPERGAGGGRGKVLPPAHPPEESPLA